MNGAEYIFRLPWPPSVNRYWRYKNGRAILSSGGRNYQKKACPWLLAQKPQGFMRLENPVAITLHFYMPDRRKRDLDNCMKAVFDCLTRAGIWKDDSLAHEIHALRYPVVKGGLVRIFLKQRMGT